jgi:AmmeMemoRadiSam system protein A
VLSDEDQKTLLGLARETVAAAAGGHDLPNLRNPSGPLREKGAVFITLRSGGELRGCIGHVEAHEALWESVRDMAAAAALRDTRFSPVLPEEVPGLEYEISVLSPMVPVRPEEIVIGTHGLYVKLENVASGLLLPQVAVEWGWTPQGVPPAHLREGRPCAREAWRERLRVHGPALLRLKWRKRTVCFLP